jgi:hypothetical protein
MDGDTKEPTVVRALALALTKQALAYAGSLNDEETSGHLKRAIEALTKPRTAPAG